MSDKASQLYRKAAVEDTADIRRPNRNLRSNHRKCLIILGIAFVLTLTVEAFAADTSRLTIGLNFAGSTLVDSGFIPPDTMGAVGESHIIELLNGHYAVYRKSDAVRVQTSSLNQFWIDAGAAPVGFTSDSRVLYDPFSQRWFASSGDFNFDITAGDNLLLAVSNSADPTAGWTGFSIPSAVPKALL